MLPLVESQSQFVGGSSAAAAFLVDVGLRGAVLLLLAGGATLALRRASASVRHLVWTLALGGLLALPGLSLVAPELNVPGLRNLIPAPPTTVESQPMPDLQPAERLDDQLMAGGATLWAPTQLTAASQAAVEPAALDVGGTPLLAAQASLAESRRGDSPSSPSSPSSLSRYGTGSDVHWSAFVALAWAAGALVLILAMGLGIVRTWRLQRAAAVISGGRLARLAASASADLGLGRRVTLLLGGGPRMPMTWGAVRPKVLLPAEACLWSEVRLRAVMMHELAHIKRYDYVTQMLARLACALHWFNPLVWFAAHRLRVERELACDDRVLQAGSPASQYAGDLLDIARSLRASPVTAMAGIAMARPSQLSARLLAVLDPRRARSAVTAKVAIPAWLGAAFVVLPIAGAAPVRDSAPGPTPAPAERPVKSLEVGPTVPRVGSSLVVTGVVAPLSAPARLATRRAARTGPVSRSLCDWFDAHGRSSTSISVEDAEMRIKMRAGDCRLDIDARGELEFSADYTAIVGISRGGHFEVEERRGGEKRRLKIETARDGALQREWFVNGDERDYDEEARAWFGDMLLVVFRRAGLRAEERANSILAREGVDGLLQEISFIGSDYTARRYYGVLLSQADLDAATVQRVVRQAGSEISSDYELAELLITVAENQPMVEAVQVAYVEAAGRIGPDYEQRRVLSAILSREDLGSQVASSMLQSATEIGSDYELAELLIGILRAQPLEDEMLPTFFEAVTTIDSDYEQRRVLNAVFERGIPNERFLDFALESALAIRSDFEQAELLISVARAYPMDRSIPRSYLAAARSISSGYELRRVLDGLVARGGLSSEAIAELLEISLEIGSDYELTELLVGVADGYPIQGELRAAYLRAADTIGSRFEHDRALAALGRI